MPKKPVPFLDDKRHELLESIHTRYKSTLAEGKPVWISLEAESGWGKTRIIQELYKRLALEQSSQYWPESLLSDDELPNMKIEVRRKRICPSYSNFKRADNSLPDYVFWGITCVERSGRPVEVLMEDLQQIKAHLPYLLYKAQFSYNGTLTSIGNVVKDLSIGECVNQVESLAIKGIEELVVGGLPFGNIILRSIKKLFFSSQGYIQTRNRVMKEGLDDSTELSVLDEAVVLIKHIINPETPLVLCIEDLHLATPVTLELVYRLVSEVDAPIFIVTTTWPGRLERLPVIGMHLDKLLEAQKLVRYATHLDGQENALFGFDDKAKRELIKSYFPNCAEDLLEKITQQYSNPLIIELLCSMPITLGKEHTAYPIKPASVKNLPTTVESWCLKAWEEMEQETQLSLIYSAMAIPERVRNWAPKLVSDYLNDTIPYAKKIREEVDGWVTYRSEYDSSFTDDIMRKIAVKSADNFIDDEDIDVFYTSLYNKCISLQNDLHRELSMDGDGVDRELHFKTIEHLDYLVYSLYLKGYVSDDVDNIKASMIMLLLHDFFLDRNYSEFAEELIGHIYPLFRNSPTVEKHPEGTVSLIWWERDFLCRYMDFLSKRYQLDQFIKQTEDMMAHLELFIGAESESVRSLKRYFIELLQRIHAYAPATKLLQAAFEELTFPEFNSKKYEQLSGEDAHHYFWQHQKNAANKINAAHEWFQASLKSKNFLMVSAACSAWTKTYLSLVCNSGNLPCVFQFVDIECSLALLNQLNEGELELVREHVGKNIDETKSRIINQQRQANSTFIYDAQHNLERIESLLIANLTSLAQEKITQYKTKSIPDDKNNEDQEIALLTLRVLQAIVYIKQNETQAARDELVDIRSTYNSFEFSVSADAVKLAIRILILDLKLQYTLKKEEFDLKTAASELNFSHFTSQYIKLRIDKYDKNDALNTYKYEIDKLLDLIFS